VRTAHCTHVFRLPQFGRLCSCCSMHIVLRYEQGKGAYVGACLLVLACCSCMQAACPLSMALLTSQGLVLPWNLRGRANAEPCSAGAWGAAAAQSAHGGRAGARGCMRRQRGRAAPGRRGAGAAGRAGAGHGRGWRRGIRPAGLGRPTGRTFSACFVPPCLPVHARAPRMASCASIQLQ
jgi:hypothetical protein